MTDETSYIWVPPPELVAGSNLTAFLRATGQPDYDPLAAKAEADPAWLMEEVFRFCDVRFYRRYDQMLDVSRGEPWARWCVGGTTNIVLNCIDKHRDTPVWDQTFLVWEGEDAPRAAQADLPRIRPRGRPPRAGACASSASAAATWSRSTCRTCRKPLSRFSRS